MVGKTGRVYGCQFLTFTIYFNMLNFILRFALRLLKHCVIGLHARRMGDVLRFVAAQSVQGDDCGCCARFAALRDTGQRMTAGEAQRHMS